MLLVLCRGQSQHVGMVVIGSEKDQLRSMRRALQDCVRWPCACVCSD